MRSTLTLVALAVLSGCGGDDKPLRTATVPGTSPVVIVADEYSFDPGRAIVTGAPGELRITLDNAGRLAHNIRVLDGDRDLGGLRSFPAGEKRDTTVRVAPGTYRLVCTVGDHEELGMTGELQIRP